MLQEELGVIAIELLDSVGLFYDELLVYSSFKVLMDELYAEFLKEFIQGLKNLQFFKMKLAALMDKYSFVSVKVLKERSYVFF